MVCVQGVKFRRVFLQAVGAVRCLSVYQATGQVALAGTGTQGGIAGTRSRKGEASQLDRQHVGGEGSST